MNSRDNFCLGYFCVWEPQLAVLRSPFRLLRTERALPIQAGDAGTPTRRCSGVPPFFALRRCTPGAGGAGNPTRVGHARLRPAPSPPSPRSGPLSQLQRCPCAETPPGGPAPTPAPQDPCPRPSSRSPALTWAAQRVSADRAGRRPEQGQRGPGERLGGRASGSHPGRPGPARGPRAGHAPRAREGQRRGGCALAAGVGGPWHGTPGWERAGHPRAAAAALLPLSLLQGRALLSPEPLSQSDRQNQFAGEGREGQAGPGTARQGKEGKGLAAARSSGIRSSSAAES